MNIFLTNQKKLAAAAGVTQTHLSQIKKGENGVSEGMAGKLENLTKIPKIIWSSSGTKTAQLNNALKKFFKEENARETEELRKISKRG